MSHNVEMGGGTGGGGREEGQQITNLPKIHYNFLFSFAMFLKQEEGVCQKNIGGVGYRESPSSASL